MSGRRKRRTRCARSGFESAGFERAGRSCRRLLLESLEPRLVLDGGPLWISEFMADNTRTLTDEDGQYSDWIEIYNPGPGLQTLDGWYLTDSASDLRQWQFPDITPEDDITLPANSYLVVFASSKNRRIDPASGGPAPEFHTNFKLGADGEYLALVQPDGQTAACSFAPKFPGQYADISYGLSQDLSARGYLTPPTPGAAPMGDPSSSLVVISEIMYHPGYGAPGSIGYVPENTSEEYVELYNRTSGPVSLKDWGLDRWWFSAEAMKTVAIVSSAGVATATCAGHGYAPGDALWMAGAQQPEYNGVFTVTAVTANTFSYAVSGAPSSPAAGTITAQRGVRQAGSVTCDAYTATVSLANHGYADGDTILISGADQAAYNGVFAIVDVTPDSFRYTLSNIPASPATGSVLVQRAAEKMPDVSIAGLGYLVIAGDGPTFRAKYPTVANAVWAWTPKLSNSGETLDLRDAQGSRVCKVEYADEGDWATRSRGEQPVESITRSGSLATVILPYHGLTSGTVRIAGANEALYNGEFTISNVTRDTFTYTISTSAPLSATGTITATWRDVNHYGWDWYSPSDGHGKSLELVNPAMPVNQGQNWGASTVDGGTPGTANSIASGNIAPLVTDVTPSPAIPNSDQPVTVTARLTDEVPAGLSADLFYRVDGRAADGLGLRQAIPGTKIVTGITLSGSTATVTSTSHGFANGNLILISGADQPEYNGAFAISGVTTNTFNYTVVGTPASPATGSINAVSAKGLGTYGAKTITSITRFGSTATVTASGHGFSTGHAILVSGADQPEYNGVFTITYVNSNTFTYTVSGVPATPATGRMSAARSASITCAGSTATATVTGHGFVNGQTVLISGADQPEYNGYFPITYVNSSTFTYTVSGTPASPATGLVSAQWCNLNSNSKTVIAANRSTTQATALVVLATRSVTSITRSGSTATVTSTAHGFLNGDTITISGANQAEYNGTFTIAGVAANTFTYTVSSTATTPATGTITATKSGSITCAGSTATVTLPNHSFIAGQAVVISGAAQAEYNGSFVISNVTANTFDYTITGEGTPAGPASGTITAQAATMSTTRLTLTTLVRNGSTATATYANHNYAEGQTVIISGADQADFNGPVVIFNVTQNTFDYAVPGVRTGAATGVITSQPYTISRSGTTAVFYYVNHGFADGSTVRITGANPASYNGDFTIRVLSNNTFSFTLPETAAASPAGTIVAVPVQVVTRDGSTVTVTQANHGYVNGQTVLISGTSQPEPGYNGTFVISNATRDTFQYTISGTPDTPATGTSITSQAYAISRLGGTAIVSLPNHGYADGATVRISGADQPQYNGVFTITVFNNNTFTFPVSDEPASPATGALAVSYAGIIRNGSTATFPLPHHGFVEGQKVRISGASPSQYNGTFTIFNVTENTFDYSMTSAPATVAGGSPYLQTLGIFRLDAWPSTAMVYSPGHEYANGETIVIEGANQPQYNGTFTIWNVTPNTFTYAVSGAPTSPGTGWLSLNRPWTPVAMHDDGQHGDGAAGDGVFGAGIPPQGDGAIVEFYVRGVDSSDYARTWPGAAAFTGEQRANVLYQVDDTYDAGAEWTPGSAAFYRMIMTVAEANELYYIGHGYGDGNSNATMNGTFITIDGSGTEVEYRVGFRNRGHGTRSSTNGANNHKVLIPHDRSWNGRETEIINFQNPYSQVMGSALWQAAGIAGPDQYPIKVRIDGVDRALPGGNMWGYYTGKEEYSTEFTSRAFPDDPKGNIYSVYRLGSVRPDQQGDLRYEGTNPDVYRDRYFKQTNVVEDDWSDLIHMTDVLNNTPDDTWYEEVCKVIDVPQFIRYLALDILSGNGETGLTLAYGDDYALYRGVEDARFKLVPWDLDSLFSRSATSYGIFNDYMQLTGIAKLLSNPITLQMYYAELLDLINGVLAPQNFNPLVDQVLGGWVPLSTLNNIKTYMANRRAYVLTQIPRSFTVASALPTVGGYPHTPLTSAALTGTADVVTTRSVLVDGVEAEWDQRTGAWAIGSSPLVTDLVFQEGTNGYTSAADTYIRQVSPTTSYATATSLNADGDDGGGATQALLRFENLFGTNPGQIPPGATIVSARLSLTVSNSSSSGVTLNRILVPWSESITWSGSFGGNGIQADGVEAVSTPDITAASVGTGVWAVDVTAALTGWLADPASNYGWAVLPQGSDGLDFYSREYGTVANRPTLSVSYALGEPVGGAPVSPGINRLVVQTYDGPHGTGNKVAETSIDVWCDTGAGTNVGGGHITGNTTYSPAGSPYHVTSDLFVDAGATLTILPGTTIFFDAGTGLTVSGRLVAEGTEHRQIRFTRTPGGGMADGLYFLNTMEDNRISWAVIEYGERNYDPGADPDKPDRALVALDHANLTLDHVTLDHARYRRIRTVDSSLIVRNSTFTDIFPGIDEAPVANNRCEQIWGKNALPGGHIIIENNWFGTTKGHNDIIDLDGGLRSQGDPVPQILNNVFTGGGDDACDLEGDFVIAGNLFMHFRKDGYHPQEEGEGNCISAGDSDLVGHEYTIVGNVFYDNSHVALVKDRSYAWFINNTVIDIDKAALYFELPGDSMGPGRGAYVDGSIFTNASFPFDQVLPTTEFVINRSIVPDEWLARGVGNTSENPRLVDPAALDFRLGPGSPALGAGPNGLAMGAAVPLGASIAGEPPALTGSTAAALTVGGPGVVAYKYRVNGGTWSIESDASAPIVLAGLGDGTYTVEVLGRTVAGAWQSTPTASKTWTVSTSLGRVRLNEILAINRAAFQHEGTYPDLIELVNDGVVAVDLSGMGISDRPNNFDKYVFPSGTVLAPGEFLVLYADNETTSGLHLGFKLDGDRGGVYLFDTVEHGSVLLDAVVYGKQVADLSIGRVGHNAEWALTAPSLGAANVAARTGDPAGMRINEWFTNGDVRLGNDFVELANTDPLPVCLAGLWLTDDPVARPAKTQIAPLSFVAGNGLVHYIADGDTQQGSNHLSFQLSAGKEWIALLDAEFKTIDKVVHYAQTTDVAQGRYPDGGVLPSAFLTVPTPGLSNVVADNVAHLLSGLRISELMYNPAGDGDLEFIEVVNVGATTLDLAGVRLTGGVDFAFPAVLLAPGQYAVIARNVGKFAEFYGPGVNLLGEYSNKMSDGGDALQLQLPSPYEAHILDFSFKDGWYRETDGAGYALVIRDASGPAAGWDDKESWQAGARPGGSPGRGDAETLSADVVINEVLTHTDEPLTDAIELCNTTGAAIDIGGWYLSDDAGTLKKFRIPDGTVLPAYGYIVFYQGHWVNHLLEFAENEFSFGLSSYKGDQVWLSAADTAGNVVRVVDYVDFAAMANGESLGRWPNAAGSLVPMRNRTLDAPHNHNSAAGNGPRVGPVIISEIMYSPAALTAAEIAAGFSTAQDMEYVEIFNSTSVSVDLTHWQLAKGVAYPFAASSWLAPRSVLVVVPFDPANAAMLQAFRDRYGMSASVTVVGPYSGHLAENGEKIELQDADEPPLEDPTFWPPLLQDQVIFDPAWGAAGDGYSLQRVGDWGNDPASWTAVAPAPGQFVDLIAPRATIVAIAPNTRTSGVTRIQIVFSEPVEHFGLADLRLALGGGPNLLTGAQTLHSDDDRVWTLGNLQGITTASGDYLLTLVAAGSNIADLAGNLLTVDSSAAWVCTLNTAPTLDAGGDLTLAAIVQDDLSSTGTLVWEILASAGGNPITDPDAGALEGIAVVGVDLAHGTWQYSTDDGAHWSSLGAVAPGAARLLAADLQTRVRFLPFAGWWGTVEAGITFCAWDQTSGSNGGLADTTASGGTTAFSTGLDTASIRVLAAPSLDADGNGVCDPLTDGILILRYLFDPTGAWSVSDALGTGAMRTTAGEIVAFLDRARSTALDADGNGVADPLSDGILILRYLFDRAGEWRVDDAIGSGATRTTRDEIRADLDLYEPALNPPPGPSPAGDAEPLPAGDGEPLAADGRGLAAQALVATAIRAESSEKPVAVANDLSEAEVLSLQPAPVADTAAAPASAVDAVLCQWPPAVPLANASEPFEPLASLQADTEDSGLWPDR